MRGEPLELNCPFCDKGKIQVWYIPSVWGEKHSGRSSLGSGRKVTKTSDVWLIRSGCSICGKPQEEVETKLKEDNII
jgi:hypothetical protein